MNSKNYIISKPIREGKTKGNMNEPPNYPKPNTPPPSQSSNYVTTILDCRTPEGITIGLIDSLISISRVLSKRDLTSFEIREALKDLKQDRDLKFILS